MSGSNDDNFVHAVFIKGNVDPNYELLILSIMLSSKKICSLLDINP